MENVNLKFDGHTAKFILLVFNLLLCLFGDNLHEIENSVDLKSV